MKCVRDGCMRPTVYGTSLCLMHYHLDRERGFGSKPALQPDGTRPFPPEAMAEALDHKVEVPTGTWEASGSTTFSAEWYRLQEIKGRLP